MQLIRTEYSSLDEEYYILDIPREGVFPPQILLSFSETSFNTRIPMNATIFEEENGLAKVIDVRIENGPLTPFYYFLRRGGIYYPIIVRNVLTDTYSLEGREHDLSNK